MSTASPHDSTTRLQGPLEHRITQLDSGLQIVTEAMPDVRSVALGYWIGTGSRHEADDEAGLSHLIEHLLFKGSSKYASIEIDRIIEAMGTEMDACTDKETTSLEVRVIGDHLTDAFDLMSEMVWRPAFREVEAEREVILEEIAMYEDDSEDKVFDVLGQAIFGEHPLGRPVRGHAEVIARTPVERIVAFHAERYVPANIVVAAAGAVDHDRLVELADAHAPDSTTRPSATPPAPEPLPRGVCFEHKDAEQFHVCVGGLGLPRTDERRFALQLLDAAFGGLGSSRLFQEVREQRGLAYEVSSFSDSYADSGYVGLYVGVRQENLSSALEVIATELARLRREPLSLEELTHAKENLKGSVLLSLESTDARMHRLGACVMGEEPLLPIDEVIARIDSVTQGDLAALASELFAAERLSVAGIGPDEAAFAEAVAPLASP